MNVSSLNLLLIGLFIRILILCTLEYFERLNDVPLTDVDYYVFTDAANYVKRGLSPYKR
jgi:phosphatidylinositol glycan class M